MSLPSSQELISEVVRDWTTQELLFTAYDVSRAVQSLQKERRLPFERHVIMKQDVHNEVTEYIRNGVYQNRIQSIGTAVPPWIYFPEGGNARVYVDFLANGGSGPCNMEGQPADLSATVTAAPANTVNPANSQAVAAATNSVTSITLDATPAGARRPDARGSIVVPSSLLKDAQLAPKETAWIFSIVHDNKPAIRISKFQNPNDPDPLTNYTVDYHNNVRITESIVEQAGMTVGRNAFYTFSGDLHSVIVQNHE